MPEIPSFLNRVDFLGNLLPGYVVIVAYLAVFRPELLLSEKAPPFDIFSTVVLVVAGPALGLTLAQLHRLARAIYSRIKPGNNNDYREKYAELCLQMKVEEKLELDEIEAIYDFCASTGIGLMGLSIYGLFLFSGLFYQSALLLVTGILLLVEAYFEDNDSYSPTMQCLEKKYST
jgi:hypothetical protein